MVNMGTVETKRNQTTSRPRASTAWGRWARWGGFCLTDHAVLPGCLGPGR
jgi:hypothetical protein